MGKKLNSFKRCVRTTAELKQQNSKRLILLRSTLTLWQCASKVISAFLIFAVIVLRVIDCRPYTLFKLLSFFLLIYFMTDMMSPYVVRTLAQ